VVKISSSTEVWNVMITLLLAPDRVMVNVLGIFEGDRWELEKDVKVGELGIEDEGAVSS
jgi:hypothetical protein